MDFCNSVASRRLVVGRDVVGSDVVECGSCAELIALAVALHLLLNFDFEQIAKNDEAKRGEGETEGSGSVSALQGVGGCGVASEQQSLDCGIVDCQHLVEGA